MDLTRGKTDDFERVSRIFKALGHPTRVYLLTKIIEEPVCVSELQAGSNRSQSNISQHLGVLRNAGLVIPERRGNLTCYRVADDRVKRLLEVARRML